MAERKFVVEPIPFKKQKKKKARGHRLFTEPYPNVFLCAKKKSGKTTVIYNILKHCCGPDTQVKIFCSTHEKDDAYKSIKHMLDTKGVNYECFHSIKEDGMNLIDLFMQENKNAPVEDLKPPKPVILPKMMCCSRKGGGSRIVVTPDMKIDALGRPVHMMHNNTENNHKPKKKKDKYISPEYIIILDDLGSEMRNIAVNKLLKTNRHYKSMILCSSQWPNDLEPQALKQLDYTLLFGNMPNHKVEHLRREMDLTIPEHDFNSLYDDTTQDKFSFMYIDPLNMKFKKNFG